MLGPEIVVRSAELVAGELRRPPLRATGVTYRYTIVNRAAPDPFLARYAWWVPTPLDLAVLRLGADPFVGEHDFASFCRRALRARRPCGGCSSRAWVDLGDGVLRYEIRATAFCWQMVRSIVGTLVDVGIGKRPPGDMLRSCGARPRRRRPRRATPRPVPLGRRLLKYASGHRGT